MESRDPEAIILFDGDCSFCNRSVQFVLKRDPKGRFRFAALQSPAAHRLLKQAGQQRERLPDSVVLIEQGRVYTRSSAALRIAQHLNGVWPLLSVLRAIPIPLRDLVYDLIAKNRYRLFGRQEACLLPTPEIKLRFLSE